MTVSLLHKAELKMNLPCAYYISTTEVQILVNFVLWAAIFEIQLRWSINGNWLNDLKYLDVKVHDIHLSTYSWSLNFALLLYNQLFSRNKVVDNWKLVSFSAKLIMYQLTSTNIPTYFKATQKIQGHQKLEMHWMTPNWPWTLNNDKYSALSRH